MTRRHHVSAPKRAGRPSASACQALSERVRREVADAEVRLSETCLRSDALLAAGFPREAAAVMDEQTGILRDLESRVAVAVADAAVEREAEAVVVAALTALRAPDIPRRPRLHGLGRAPAAVLSLVGLLVAGLLSYGAGTGTAGGTLAAIARAAEQAIASLSLETPAETADLSALAAEPTTGLEDGRLVPGAATATDDLTGRPNGGEHRREPIPAPGLEDLVRRLLATVAMRIEGLADGFDPVTKLPSGLADLADAIAEPSAGQASPGPTAEGSEDPRDGTEPSSSSQPRDEDGDGDRDRTEEGSTTSEGDPEDEETILDELEDDAVTSETGGLDVGEALGD